MHPVLYNDVPGYSKYQESEYVNLLGLIISYCIWKSYYNFVKTL